MKIKLITDSDETWGQFDMLEIDGELVYDSRSGGLVETSISELGYKEIGARNIADWLQMAHLCGLIGEEFEVRMVNKMGKKEEQGHLDDDTSDLDDASW